MKEVVWRRNLHYFYKDAGTYTEGSERIYKFLEKYNCSIADSTQRIFVCDEEDFVAIMLACPDAVAEVLDETG